MLSELSLQAARANSPEQPRSSALGNASADFNQKSYEVRKALDGVDALGWAIGPEVNKDHAAAFETVEEIGDGKATRLTVRLDQLFYMEKRLLGRFRLSFTNDAVTLQTTRLQWDLKDSEVVDLNVALARACAEQGRTTGAIVSFAEAISLAVDRTEKAKIIAAAAPLAGVLEKLAKRAAGDARFQAELARYYADHGNPSLAEAARTKACALFEDTLAKEPVKLGMARGTGRPSAGRRNTLDGRQTDGNEIRRRRDADAEGRRLDPGQRQEPGSRRLHPGRPPRSGSHQRHPSGSAARSFVAERWSRESRVTAISI